MRLLVSWLRDFVDVPASAADIAEGLGLRGFEVAAVEPFGNGDWVIDFEVTANRPDCLSVIGLAREVATMYDRPMTMPSADPGATIALEPLPAGQSAKLAVSIVEAQLCPRYAAAVAEVAVGPSPHWLSARLQAAGVRPISTIVDVTNYVLIELGHPTHAFDLDKLAGAEIRVRRANPGEPIRTLDGVERTLDPDMLVIADRDRAQAVAGVMGGAAAEVSAATRRVAIESAYFNPASVRRTSKRLSLKTEASYRFERGADIDLPVVALQRIAAVLSRLGVGRIAEPLIDVYPAPREPVQIHLRRNRLAGLLGITVPDKEIERILRSLGLSVAAGGDGWNVVAPSYRVDLLREVDLIEEVGRHYGFDQLPTTFPIITSPAPEPDPRIARDRLVRRVLTAAGLSEAVTFGFIEAKAAEAFLRSGDGPPIGIAHPLSAKFDTLRPSLMPGLIDSVAHNRRHGREDVGLFEIGARFSNGGETRAVGIAWTGRAAPLHWSGDGRQVDFFDVKGTVERLCDALGVGVTFRPGHEAFLLPGATANVVAAAESAVGVVGQLIPALADARGLPRQDRVYVAELNLDRLAMLSGTVSGAVRSLPRHPFVVRDLSIVVSDTLPAEIIRETILTAGQLTPAPLADVAFFDRYQGKGIPSGSVSLSLRLTFQAADRTLTDAEIQPSVDAILAALGREHQAVQR